MRPNGVAAQSTSGETAALDALFHATAGEHWLRTWDAATKPCEVSGLLPGAQDTGRRPDRLPVRARVVYSHPGRVAGRAQC
jgi:hypothetical protein